MSKLSSAPDMPPFSHASLANTTSPWLAYVKLDGPVTAKRLLATTVSSGVAQLTEEACMALPWQFLHGLEDHFSVGNQLMTDCSLPASYTNTEK